MSEENCTVLKTTVTKHIVYEYVDVTLLFYLSICKPVKKFSAHDRDFSAIIMPAEAIQVSMVALKSK